MVCVVLPNLGGKGPAVMMPPLQRELVQGQVKKLLHVAGQTGKGLLRSNAEHELIVGISRSSIDVTSLSQDSKGPFDSVRFHNAAKNAKCTLFAGQHRIETLKQLLDETIKEVMRVNKALLENINTKAL